MLASLSHGSTGASTPLVGSCGKADCFTVPGPVCTIHLAVIEKISFQSIVSLLYNSCNVYVSVLNARHVDKKLVVILDRARRIACTHIETAEQIQPALVLQGDVMTES
ncbi:MAG: hypothetical protein JAZ19_20800 [Candidatus Thiodiazotropha taylori]|nr:hypothetical protein [Candidatus Thiodiazotropha taylori]